MGKDYLKVSGRLGLLLGLVFAWQGLSAQCGANTTSGANCTRSGVYSGEVVPNAGCGNYVSVTNYSPGTHFRIPVLLGACYTVSTCGAPINTQLAAFQGANTTGPFAYNDDNGPECATTAASMTMVPNFTDYARVDVRQSSCSLGGTSSITVYVRQNNNLTFTSSGAAMCAGQSRTLTATPAPVGGVPQPNSGNTGAFSGTGVSSTTFTAPQPSTGMQTYNIQYNFGFCSATQPIDVYRAPTQALAGVDFDVCSASTNMNGNVPTYGTGTWAIISGPGTVTNANSFNATVSGLVIGSTTTLTWTITNGPCTATRDTVSIFRENPPSASVASANQALCATTANVSGNVPAVGVGLWYLLSGSGTITNPAGPATSITAIGAGTNLFVWSITNGVCPANNDTVVIIRDLPPTPAFAGPDIAMCDSTINLAGNQPVVGTGLWTIIVGSGSLAAPNNPNTAISNVPIGSSTLTWTISNGSCPPSTDTLEILRNVRPNPPTISGVTSVCEGSQTLLTASSTASIPNYRWFDAPVGGTLLASTASFSTPPITATTTYYVEVGDASTACASNRVPVTVTMVPNPVVNLGPDRSVCDNDTTCFTAPPGMSAYIWSNGATTQTACFADSGDVWVQISDANTCIGRDTAHVAFVTTLPISLGPDTSFCIGGSVTIGNFTGNNTYLWSTGANTPSISVSGSGDYSVTVTAPGGCIGVDTISVTAFPAVQSSFTVDTSFCPIIVFVDNSVGASSWSWTFGDGGQSTDENPLYTYQGNGTFTVTLTVTGLCGTNTSTQTVPVSCLVGMDMPDNLQVTVYPNPNHGTFKVQFGGLEDDAEITLLNELGQVVYQRQLVGERGEVETQVSLQDASAGMYFLHLRVGDAKVAKRVLIH